MDSFVELLDTLGLIVGWVWIVWIAFAVFLAIFEDVFRPFDK